MVYGRWCPKRARGTGQAGQTSLAGWARQGRSRGSICVYRTTRVWDRRCSDTSAIIARRLAPIRPSRQHYAHLLVRFTPPPLPRRRPPCLLRSFIGTTTTGSSLVHCKLYWEPACAALRLGSDARLNYINQPSAAGLPARLPQRRPLAFCAASCSVHAVALTMFIRGRVSGAPSPLNAHSSVRTLWPVLLVRSSLPHTSRSILSYTLY